MYKNKKIAINLLFAIIVTCISLFNSYALEVTKQLAPGLTFYQFIDNSLSNPTVVNAVYIDLNNTDISIKSSLVKDFVYIEELSKGRGSVSSVTTVKGALVGINADFFPMTWAADPLGIAIIDGELISEPFGTRVAFALNKNGGVFFDIPKADISITHPNGTSRQIEGINRGRNSNEIIAFTKKFGTSTKIKFKSTDVILTGTDTLIQAGKTLTLTVSEMKSDSIDSPIPENAILISGGGTADEFLKSNLKVGDIVTLKIGIKSDAGFDWSGVTQSVGGGPWLVKDSQIAIDYAFEGFTKSFSETTHPRTGIGVTKDNKLIIATVDGRQAISKGLSLNDFAAQMKKLGAVNAINLDGGGSTTMSIKGMIVNSPSDGRERAVANTLLVFCKPTSITDPLPITIEGLTDNISCGLPIQVSIGLSDPSKTLPTDFDANTVWGTTGNIGFINQKGYFIPSRAGKGSIFIFNTQYCTQTSKQIQVVAGYTSKVNVTLTPDKTNPQIAAAQITATDTCGMNVPNANVIITVTGGTADITSGTTDSKGQFTVNITWNADAVSKSVTAEVEGIKGVAVGN